MGPVTKDDKLSTTDISCMPPGWPSSLLKSVPCLGIHTPIMHTGEKWTLLLGLFTLLFTLAVICYYKLIKKDPMAHSRSLLVVQANNGRFNRNKLFLKPKIVNV